MNSLIRLIVSISALIASLSSALIALAITDMIPHVHVTVYHDGSVGLSSGFGGFEMTHSGSLDMTHDGSLEITR